MLPQSSRDPLRIRPTHPPICISVGRIEITFPQLDLGSALSKFEAAGIVAPFPRLSTFVLNVAERPLNVQSVQYRPRVSNLRFFSTPRPSNAPSIAPSLKTLEIEAELLIEECSTIFQSFPCLIHFRIVSIDSDSLPSPKIGHVPPLESLNLDEEAFGLLACVTLPHLRRLHCTLELDEDVHTLAEFLARSACLLIDLTLRIRLVTDDSALLQCLEPHPALETLRMHRIHIHRERTKDSIRSPAVYHGAPSPPLPVRVGIQRGIHHRWRHRHASCQAHSS
ncbi:hypothetical protein B0H14DRAFT_3430722 [Mycena olivaceomarginata]|nr:hypothetical protein B0H14DRAFT_3430722 [Mycena olivaceomarginata]